MTDARTITLPTAGGSYVRQKDGSLALATAPSAAPEADVAVAPAPEPEAPAADSETTPVTEV